MTDKHFKAGANYSVYNDRIELFMKRGNLAGEVKFEKEIDPGMWMEPSAVLSPGEAQEIADALWSAGIRPTQGRNSEGVTAAQERHLADMRAIVFAKLNIEQPANRGG